MRPRCSEAVLSGGNQYCVSAVGSSKYRMSKQKQFELGKDAASRHAHIQNIEYCINRDSMNTKCKSDLIPKVRALHLKPFRRFPIPTRVLSNGEFDAIGQTAKQKAVETYIERETVLLSSELGLARREVLLGSAGILLGLLAMNKVFGPLFNVSRDDVIGQLSGKLDSTTAGQFIFDMQTHLVRDDFSHRALTYFATWTGRSGSDPKMRGRPIDMSRFRFSSYVREIFFGSETDVVGLSGAPFSTGDSLPNPDLFGAVDAINGLTGGRGRLAYGYYLVNPMILGWKKKCIQDLKLMKPSGWKLFPMGEPMSPYGQPWRLDDKMLIYPFYELASKLGIKNICIHKGLVREEYEKRYPAYWRSAQVDDVRQAAKDWPELNFIIFHSALRPFAGVSPEFEMNEFEASGRIRWTSDLIDMASEIGTGNIFAELGTSFASTAVTYPRFCAAFIGSLVNGLGADRVLWGTDSVWFGSPQWQIEAFRRLEIPDDMYFNRGWTTRLGGRAGSVKNQILGLNAARLFGLKAGQQVKRYPILPDYAASAESRYHERAGFYSGEA